MKKRQIIEIVFVLALFTLMALGSGNSTVRSSPKISEPSSVSTSDTITTTNSKETKKVENENVITIPETVVYNSGGITVTAKSFDDKDIFGPGVKMLIENNTSKGVIIQTRNVSVNGYMVDSIMSSDVAAGKKSNDTLTIMNSSLETAGITTIADIEFGLHIIDSESWDTIADTKAVKIETSSAKGFNYVYDNSGKQLYNENGIEIVAKGLSEDSSFLGPSLILYICNTCGQDITVQARDTSVNGFMMDPFFSCDIASEKHALDTLSFMKSELEENGIDKINEIELSFHIFSADSWDTIVDTPSVTLTFN